MIKKRLFGPRKVIIAMKLNTSIIADPAVDVIESKIDDYWEDYFDVNKLKMKNGETPSVFTIKGLNRKQREYALQFDDGGLDSTVADRNSKANWFIRCGLIGISNYKIADDNGEKLIDYVKVEPNGQYGEMLTEEFLDFIDFSTYEKIVIFSMIQKLSEASSPLLVV